MCQQISLIITKLKLIVNQINVKETAETNCDIDNPTTNNDVLDPIVVIEEINCMKCNNILEKFILVREGMNVNICENCLFDAISTDQSNSSQVNPIPTETIEEPLTKKSGTKSRTTTLKKQSSKSK